MPGGHDFADRPESRIAVGDPVERRIRPAPRDERRAIERARTRAVGFVARAGRLRAQRFPQIVDPRRRIEYESRPRLARHHAGAKALGANQVAIGVRDVRVLRGEPRISLQLPDGAFPLARHAEQLKQRPTARRIDGPGAHRGLRSREPRVERRIVRPGRRARAGRRREGRRRHAPCSEVATGAGSGLSIASV